MTYILMIIFVIMLAVSGCFAQAKKKSKPQTMTEWVKQQNDKKEKCNESGWYGSGSNGFDSWSESCVNGVIVYKDTTKETQEYFAKEEAHKAQLITAARSRLLSDKETKELLDYGPYIFTRNMQLFYQADIEKSFNELLFQQMRFKTLPKHDSVESLNQRIAELEKQVSDLQAKQSSPCHSTEKP